MEDSNVFFSAPLQQLKDEHMSLRSEMTRFYELIEEIECDTGHSVVQLFMNLYQQVLVFTDKLRAHSKREEEGLFPMMTRHLGENDRTIEVMESEHDKAEQHLQDFLTEAEKFESSIDEDDVQWITVFAFQAQATLTQHFAKEEKALFPLAERLLSIDEKAELERWLKLD